ncbi:kinase-like protein, partial [Lizonia empirigonia]
WLWNEREQLEARYRRFNVASLQQAACQAVGAKKCISLQKIGEGNYNKAYRLEMEDGQKVIAKIPHPNAGPQVLTIASEVATMEFAQTILDIPVPKVLAWSATDQNPVQAEYIIMEEAKGSQLHEVWQDLSLWTKCDIVREFVDVEKRLLSVSFEKLGSLYFQDSGIAGCEPAIVTNGPEDIIGHIESRYCIGPVTRREFWEKQHSDMHYHGPWISSTEYLDSVTRREIEWINAHANPQRATETPWHYTSPDQNSPKAHIALLQKFQSTIPHIVPKDPELVSPRLWHPDFHSGNIYIDDQARISSIIDWQGAWTTPVFIGANPPLLLDYGVGTSEPCPYHFSAEEIQKHYEEAETFNKSQELWKGLQGILTDEGYASNESFSKAVEILKELREVGLANLMGEGRSNFDDELGSKPWRVELSRHW